MESRPGIASVLYQSALTHLLPLLIRHPRVEVPHLNAELPSLREPPLQHLGGLAGVGVASEPEAALEAAEDQGLHADVRLGEVGRAWKKKGKGKEMLSRDYCYT